MTDFKRMDDRRQARKRARMAGIAAQASKLAYSNAFDEFYDLLDPLEPDKFWAIIAPFRIEIINYLSAGVEHAAWEIFRKVLRNKSAYSVEDLIQFSKTYYGIKATTSEALYEGRMDKGGDGLDDLIDSLPLAGREVHEKAAKGFYGTIEALEEAVLEAVIGEEKLMKFICHGENYIAMKLKEAAQKAFRSQSMHLLRDDAIDECIEAA